IQDPQGAGVAGASVDPQGATIMPASNPYGAAQSQGQGQQQQEEQTSGLGGGIGAAGLGLLGFLAAASMGNPLIGLIAALLLAPLGWQLGQMAEQKFSSEEQAPQTPQTPLQPTEPTPSRSPNDL